MAKMGLGGGAAAGAAPGAGTSFFPAKGSPARYDMAKAFLSTALQSAGQSSSPWVQALAPLMGAAIGGGLEKQREDYTAQQTAGLTDDLLGTMAADPKARRYLDIIGNPDVPDHLKSIAQTMLGKTLNPPAAGGGGGGGSRKMREDVNGILRYLDTGEEVFPGVVRAPGAAPSSTGTWQAQNEATKIIQDAIESLIMRGLTPEEAREAVQGNSLYAPQWGMIDGAAPATSSGGGGGPTQPPPPSDGWVEVSPGVRIREIQ